MSSFTAPPPAAPHAAHAISPALIDQLLADYATAQLTLTQIAAKHALPIRQLVRFFSSPELQAEIDAMSEVVRRRAAFIAQQSIDLVSRSLRRTVAEYDEAAESYPIDPTDVPQANLRTRLREQARKAANLLMRIAKTDIAPAQPADAAPAVTEPGSDEFADRTSDTRPSHGPHADRPSRMNELALTPAAPTAAWPSAPADSPHAPPRSP